MAQISPRCSRIRSLPFLPFRQTGAGSWWMYRSPMTMPSGRFQSKEVLRGASAVGVLSIGLPTESSSISAWRRIHRQLAAKRSRFRYRREKRFPSCHLREFAGRKMPRQFPARVCWMAGSSRPDRNPRICLRENYDASKSLSDSPPIIKTARRRTYRDWEPPFVAYMIGSCALAKSRPKQE